MVAWLGLALAQVKIKVTNRLSSQPKNAILLMLAGLFNYFQNYHDAADIHK